MHIVLMCLDKVEATQMDLHRQFKAELAALLEKYGAEICWEYSDCSDMHWVYDAGIHIETTWLTPKDKAWTFVIPGQGFEAKAVRDEECHILKQAMHAAKRLMWQ